VLLQVTAPWAAPPNGTQCVADETSHRVLDSIMIVPALWFHGPWDLLAPVLRARRERPRGCRAAACKGNLLLGFLIFLAVW
jgi:hypothetical protein